MRDEAGTAPSLTFQARQGPYFSAAERGSERIRALKHDRRSASGAAFVHDFDKHSKARAAGKGSQKARGKE